MRRCKRSTPADDDAVRSEAPRVHKSKRRRPTQSCVPQHSVNCDADGTGDSVSSDECPKPPRKQRRVRSRVTRRFYSVSARKSTVKSEMVRVLISLSEKNRATHLLQCQQMGKSLWHLVYPDDDKDLCKYCYQNKASTIDHIFPMIQNQRPTGHGNSPYNLIPCCMSCNSSKSSGEVYSWLQKVYARTGCDPCIAQERIDKIKSYVSLGNADYQAVDVNVLSTIYGKWSTLVDGIMLALDEMTKRTAVDICQWQAHMQDGAKRICDHVQQL